MLLDCQCDSELVVNWLNAEHMCKSAKPKAVSKNEANAEEQKQLKRYATTLMEVETAVAEEMRMRADIEDQAGIAERRGNALAGELEEARMLLDTG